MFYGADHAALLEINRHLATTVATHGEFLAREGEISREMHFVLSGEIHILDKHGEAEQILHDGSIVCEVCLVFDIPSPFDAQVVQTATLFTLQENVFFEIALKFPALLKRIHARGEAGMRLSLSSTHTYLHVHIHIYICTYMSTSTPTYMVSVIHDISLISS